MNMAIGSTRVGLALKDQVKAYLEGEGHTVDDLGMQTDGEFVPYYEVAARVGRAVSRGDYAKAVLVCGTGAGMMIVANKFKGVYAVQASSEYEGRRATEVNNANVVTLGEWITAPQHAIEIVKVWLGATFTEGFKPEWQAFLKDAYDKIGQIESESLAGR